ncbi:MAG TPA: prolipoprotein diacylglyceryl transferase family protein, partial [Anaerolineae bacterium]|nr:prolipoprotein diacylglyceryl transferase family protein [Anaerolineae bacterium]
MHPTLFSIGSLNIPTYTVLLDLGLILGLVLTYFEGKRALNNGTLALDAALWAIVGGIVGGRIGYVMANWRVFNEDWARAIRIWEGGLSFHGALLGGLLVLILFAQLHQKEERPVSFWQLADVITPGLGLGIAFGWAACLMGGCAYGALGEGFGFAILPDIYGVEASRFAAQAVGLAYSLVLFLGFWLLRGHWPFAGATFLMYGLLYLAGQFFLESTRGDEAVYVGPWRLAQVLNLVLALAAAAGLLVLWWHFKKAAEQPGRGTEVEWGIEEPTEATGTD